MADSISIKVAVSIPINLNVADSIPINMADSIPTNMADSKQEPEPVSTQLTCTLPMSTGGNRNALDRTVGLDRKRDWSYGLFDCFSACGTCCYAVFCPCIVYGENRQRLHSLQYQGTPLSSTKTIDAHCCMYCGLLLVSSGHGCWMMQVHTRKEARERYSIRAGPLDDYLYSLFCGPCSLTQERREIELEEKSFVKYRLEDTWTHNVSLLLSPGPGENVTLKF